VAQPIYPPSARLEKQTRLPMFIFGQPGASLKFSKRHKPSIEKERENNYNYPLSWFLVNEP
jgi:hypothetical protein